MWIGWSRLGQAQDTGWCSSSVSGASTSFMTVSSASNQARHGEHKLRPSVCVCAGSCSFIFFCFFSFFQSNVWKNAGSRRQTGQKKDGIAPLFHTAAISRRSSAPSSHPCKRLEGVCGSQRFPSSPPDWQKAAAGEEAHVGYPAGRVGGGEVATTPSAYNYGSTVWKQTFPQAQPHGRRLTFNQRRTARRAPSTPAGVSEWSPG